MSKTHLPDDLSRWPESPFEILDVTPQVESGELRKKYAALIRYYKPEQFPEHFQKIRAAYEIVRAIIEHRDSPGSNPVFSPSTFSPPERRPEPQPSPLWDDRPPADVPEKKPLPIPDEISEIQRIKDSIWQIVLDGDFEEGYRRLHQLLKANPDDQSLYIRVYWMHVLFPDLDEINPPSRWLVTGLLNSREKNHLYELLNRELCHSPEEASTDRFFQLILSALDGPMGYNLVRLRWENSRTRGNFVSLIANDLDQLETRLHLDSQETWVRGLVLAFEHLVWSSDDPLAESRLKSIQKSLDHVTDVRLGQEFQLDHLDTLIGLAKSWKAVVADMKSGKHVVKSPLDSDPLLIEDLVPAYWIATGSHYLTIVTRSASAIAEDPHRTFAAIDFLAAIRSPLIIQIARTLDQWIQFHFPDDIADPTSEEKNGIIQSLYPYLEKERKRISFADFRSEEQKNADYQKFRELILELVVSEYTWYGSIMQALRSSEVPQPLSERLAERLDDDFPLRIVSMIHHMYWYPLRKRTGKPDLTNLDYSDKILLSSAPPPPG
ncbi:MAG: J domain-containing protein [Planctomycetaceae bacterium]|nr:J domain-containing protein [Planctomycetaceae bacterium]